MSCIKNMNNITNLLKSTGCKKHYQVCNSTLSDRLDFKKVIEKKKFTCSLCKDIFEDVRTYYTHYQNAHNTISDDNHTSPSDDTDADDDINYKNSHYKTKKYRPKKYLMVPKTPTSQEQNQQNQQMDTSKYIEPVTYNIRKIPDNERYKKILKALILEKRSTGKINKAKLMGPLFWKYALIKVGLLGNKNMIIPKKFPDQLKLQKCIACCKCFVSIPRITLDDYFIFTSQLPCSFCLITEDVSVLNIHKDSNHSETPPYICGKCLLITNTWYDYVQHTIKHLRHKNLCNKCICN